MRKVVGDLDLEGVRLATRRRVRKHKHGCRARSGHGPDIDTGQDWEFQDNSLKIIGFRLFMMLKSGHRGCDRGKQCFPKINLAKVYSASGSGLEAGGKISFQATAKLQAEQDWNSADEGRGGYRSEGHGDKKKKPGKQKTRTIRLWQLIGYTHPNRTKRGE